MTKYLLLRDNKQTGPYSSDELIQKGLKAYDLVWAEGKSAAWRYPSEIDELKSFAPAVEEQPFDRFFKKPSAEGVQPQPIAAIVDNKSTASGIVPHAPVPTIDQNVFAVNATNPTGFPGESSTQQGKRIIYVTMPAGGTKPVPVVSEKQTSTYNNQAAERRDGGSVYDRRSGERNDGASMYDNDSAERRDGGSVYDNGAGLQERAVRLSAGSRRTAGIAHLEEGQLSSIPGLESEYSEENISQRQPDGEINPRDQQGVRRGMRRVVQPLMIAGSILLLLAAGVFIGVSIDKNEIAKKLAVNEESHPAATKLQAEPPVTKVVAPAVTETSIPVSTAATTTDTAVKTQPNDHAVLSAVRRTVSPANAAVKEKALLPPQKAQAFTADSSVVKDSAVNTYPVTHREANHRADVSADKMDKDVLRNNMSSLVSLGASHYTVGPFGGISGLQLTVSNRSEYALDLVVVEVQYIQSNKKVFKTENLYFRGVGAGAALMLEAPQSNRGIKVEYKITSVNSKELGLSYSAL